MSFRGYNYGGGLEDKISTIYKFKKFSTPLFILEHMFHLS